MTSEYDPDLNASMINFRLLFTINILNAYDYIDDTLATKDEQQIQAHKVIPSSKRSFSNINSIQEGAVL